LPNRYPPESSTEPSPDRETRLALVAASGVGKTAVIRHLQNDPRVATFLVVDVDSYRDPVSPHPDRESRALHRMLKRKVDTLFGVMVDERTRALLEKHGWSFIVLSLPEAIHRERFKQKLAGGRRAAMTLEESLDVQRRLEGLGYQTIDAARSVEDVGLSIVRTIKTSTSGERFAILASWGVGKSALAQHLRNDAARNDREWSSRLIVDCSCFMPGDVARGELHAAQGAGDKSAQRWNRAERHAVRALMKRKVDVVGAVLHKRTRRALLEEKGFSIVVLSLPESMHRTRLAKRLRETGKVVNADDAVRMQRRLESFGYQTIDAGRGVREIADDVVEEIDRLSFVSA
jgi:hypothetical protein